MSQDPPNLIDKVALVHIVDRGVWFTETDKPFLVNWGGKRNRKSDGTPETDLETLIREVREEGSVEVVPSTARHIFTLEGHALDGRPLRESFYVAEFVGTPVPSGEVKAFRRLTTADVGAPYMTPMGNEFLRRLAALDLID